MLLLTEGILKNLLKMRIMLNQKNLECGRWNLIIHGIGEEKINIQSFFKFFSNFLTKKETIKINTKYSNIRKV